MRILIFHGYLLHGTGSNVYNAELANALVKAGHEVHLLCQERNPLEQPWVDAVGDWDSGELKVEVKRSPVKAIVYRPNIGGLLPVYVADRYEGIEARPFQHLSEEELEYYIDSNVEAVRDVAARVDPDLALANHLVMAPVILARALGRRVPYAIKVHGSDLEYTVKPYRSRFLPYAQEGVALAQTLLVGSEHTGNSLLETMGDPELAKRVQMGPPGVNIERFTPRPPRQRAQTLAALKEMLRSQAVEGSTDGSGASSFTRNTLASAQSLDTIDQDADRLVVFLGKFIGSKGVELLLAAWPYVLREVPNARLVLTGFGDFEEGLRQLEVALADGDLEQARSIHGEKGQELPYLERFLDSLSAEEAERYKQDAAPMPAKVTWLGRLVHDELADLLPLAEALIVPSTFPEAFGMVAIEGIACGALAIVAHHSGLAEVIDEVREALPDQAKPLVSFDLDHHPVRALAANIATWLNAPESLRQATTEAAVQRVRELYSWESVAKTVIDAALGKLLPNPGRLD
jgi:glycosyltransferase involved in cell wall biosynthesis